MQIGEQIPQLVGLKLLQDVVGHQGRGGFLQLLNIIVRDFRLLPLGIDKDHLRRLVLDNQPCYDRAVFEQGDVALEFLSDYGTGIDRADEQKIPVGSIGKRQIRTHCSPFIEKLVAGGAVFDEERLTVFRVTRKCSQVVVKPADIGEDFFLGGWVDLAPYLPD